MGKAKVVFNGTGLIYFEPRGTAVQQALLMSTKCFMEVCPNVRLDILVTEVTNIPMYLPKKFLSQSSDIMARIIDRRRSTRKNTIR